MDNRGFSLLIDQIYESALSGDWLDVLESIRLVTKSNKIFYQVKSSSTNEPLIVESIIGFHYDPNILTLYVNELENDPWYQLAKLSLQGELLKYSELIPVSSFENSAMYQNIFLPMRTYHCIGGVLLRNENYEGTFAINRGSDDPPYNEEDIEFLELAMTHLSRALAISLELQAYKNVASIAEGISRNSSKAILLCDKDAKIIKLNDHAADILTSSSYFSSNTNSLRITIDYLDSKLSAIIAENAKFTHDKIRSRQVLMLDDIKGETLIVEAAPLMREYSHSGKNIDCCLLTITAEMNIDWQCVTKEFGLTFKEQQVSQLVYSKKRVSDIAQVLSMKENTVRTHLQNIYAKVRVSTQAEFIITLNLFSN